MCPELALFETALIIHSILVSNHDLYMLIESDDTRVVKFHHTRDLVVDLRNLWNYQLVSFETKASSLYDVSVLDAHGRVGIRFECMQYTESVAVYDMYLSLGGCVSYISSIDRLSEPEYECKMESIHGISSYPPSHVIDSRDGYKLISVDTALFRFRHNQGDLTIDMMTSSAKHERILFSSPLRFYIHSFGAVYPASRSIYIRDNTCYLSTYDQDDNINFSCVYPSGL